MECCWLSLFCPEHQFISIRSTEPSIIRSVCRIANTTSLPCAVPAEPKFSPPEMRHASPRQITAHINIPTHSLLLLFSVVFAVADETRLQIHHCQLREHFLFNFFHLFCFLSTFFSGPVLRSLKSGESFSVLLQSRNERQQNRMVSQVFAR